MKTHFVIGNNSTQEALELFRNEVSDWIANHRAVVSTQSVGATTAKLSARYAGEASAYRNVEQFLREITFER